VTRRATSAKARVYRLRGRRENLEEDTMMVEEKRGGRMSKVEGREGRYNFNEI
jgi:hypothetical protein